MGAVAHDKKVNHEAHNMEEILALEKRFFTYSRKIANAYVYVILFKNGCVKVGRLKNGARAMQNVTIESVMKARGVEKQVAQAAIKKYNDGAYTYSKLMTPYSRTQTRVHIIYEGVEYNVKQLAIAIGASTDCARNRIHRVIAGSLTAAQAFRRSKWGKDTGDSLTEVCANLGPRMRIDEVKLGSWETAQLEG